LTGVSEVNPPECRIGGEDRHVARFQTVHRLPISVQAGKFFVFGHIHLLLELFLQCFVTARESVLKKVGHRNQFDRTTRRGKSIPHRTRAAAAASDQRQVDRVVFRGVHVRDRHPNYRGACDDFPSRREEFAA